MEYDLPWQIFLHHFKCTLYATTYVIRSYLVQSTREVRKLKCCVWARLVKRLYDQCLYTSLSVTSDYTITGSKPDFCIAGELTHLPPGAVYMRLCAGPGEWISMNSGNVWPPHTFGAKQLLKLILIAKNCYRQVSDAQNFRNCHKQVLNNKNVWNCVLNILQYIIAVNKMLKINVFSFFTSIKPLYCIITSVWAFD